MEKGSRFNLMKLSSFFTSSCKTQNLDEVIDHTTSKNPIFTPHNPILFIEQHHSFDAHAQEFEEEEEDDDEKYPFRNLVTRPKKVVVSSSGYQQRQPTSSSSSSSRMMCKPRCPETFDQMIRENCIIGSNSNPFLSRKPGGRYSLLSPSGDFSGRRCPPASPASPLFLKQKQGKMKDNTKKKGKISYFRNNNNMKNGLKSNPFNFSSSSSNDSDDNGYLFSSDNGEDDDDEKENVFSLKSMSLSSKSISLSSDSDNPGTRTQTRTRRSGPRRRKGGSRRKEVGVVPLEGKVKDTFAVVKSSSDPYNDFRTSMVEMIIEKQIFGAKELEQLLQCFLSLNSTHHHRVIAEVFTEICDALFSHTC